jgi:drug/metabolite transporter (DMT)-like permease
VRRRPLRQFFPIADEDFGAPVQPGRPNAHLTTLSAIGDIAASSISFEIPMPLGTLYAVVLISAIAQASWNAMVKKSGDRLLMLASIRVVGLTAGIVVETVVPPPSVQSLTFLIGAAAIHYAYYALMLNSYRVGDMSQVYPIARGVAPLLVVLLGTFLAGDTLNGLSTIAVCVLSLGILWLAFSGKTISRHAFIFAIGTGIAIAGYSFLSGLGIRKSGSILGYIAWLEIATGVGMTSVAYFRRRDIVAEFIQTNWRSGLIAGLLSVTGYAIALWAMTMAAMASVVALRETSVVFAALIGSVFLGEGFAIRRIAASITVAFGVILLSMAAR